MIDIVMQNNAIVLETKVNVLAHIGLIPGSTQIMTRLEVSALLAAVNSIHTPDDIMKKAGDKIIEMSLLMNDGLNLVKKKMTSDECVKCGKCEELTSITEMLLEDDPPISEVHTLIQKYWGEIKPGDISGSDNPMVALINALSGSTQGPELDTTGSMRSPSNIMDGISNIIQKHFGKNSDKDTLH